MFFYSIWYRIKPIKCEQELNVDLDTDINETFSEALEAIENLDDDLMNNIITDELQVRSTYDKVQRGTVLLKTDMLVYLNIDVDYLDADGD